MSGCISLDLQIFVITKLTLPRVVSTKVFGGVFETTEAAMVAKLFTSDTLGFRTVEFSKFASTVVIISEREPFWFGVKTRELWVTAERVAHNSWE